MRRMPRSWLILLALSLSVAGCFSTPTPGKKRFPIGLASPEESPGDAVTGSPSAPTSPGLNGPSRPGGPGGGGGSMPTK